MSTQSSSAVQRPAHRSAQEISTRIDLQFSLKYENPKCNNNLVD